MANIKTKTIDEFRPQLRNANKHSQRGMGTLEASMRKHGYVAPMTAAADGEIIDGSARLETVANVFDDDVLVVEHDGTRPIVMVRTDIASADTPEARAIGYEANRIAELNLTWDAEILLADIQSGIDLTNLFNRDELDALLSGLVQEEPIADPGGDVSRADELQEKWQVKTGDLWLLGEHKLVCGDCTDKATVDRLMQGEKAQVCVTDPPFNVRDDDWDKFDDFLGFTRLWLSIAKSVAPVVASFFADKFLPLLPKAAELEGIPFRRSLIWVKPPGSQFAGGQKDGFGLILN